MFIDEKDFIDAMAATHDTITVHRHGTMANCTWEKALSACTEFVLVSTGDTVNDRLYIGTGSRNGENGYLVMISFNK
jgi:hypothetical protein